MAYKCGRMWGDLQDVTVSGNGFVELNKWLRGEEVKRATVEFELLCKEWISWWNQLMKDFC